MFGVPLQVFGRFTRLQQIQGFPTPILWVDVSSGIIPVASIALQSDDTFWYDISAISLGAGKATLSVDTTPVAPGTDPYLVLLNIVDLLNYRFRLQTIDGNVVFAVEQSPTVEAASSVYLSASGETFQLKLITDNTYGFSSVTWELVKV